MDKNLKKLQNVLTQGSHFQLMNCLDQICQETVGHKLLTLMELENTNGTVCRTYTTDHINYPEGGYKPIPENQWSEIVISKQQSFLASSIKEIKTVFFDYQLIESLGLGSAVNMPIICFGEVLGTVNMLHEPGFYSENSIKNLQDLMPWFVIAMKGSFHKENTLEIKTNAKN